MSPAPGQEGLRNEALREALTSALSGRTAALEQLLARHGGHGTRPNLRLAAAFGAELAALPGTVAPLLEQLGDNDAAPDTPEAFLPVAAAYGWAARLAAGREVGTGWAALALLAGDERTPVRMGTLEALATLAARPREAKALVAHAGEWLELDDRETRFGAAAVAVEVLGRRQLLASLSDPEPLLDYLSRVIAAVVEAPRAAERSDARRRLLLALPATLGAVAAAVTTADRGATWLEEACRNAHHPDLRAALSDMVVALADRASGQGAMLAERLRGALKGSAKPLRDPTRLRKGSGRGRTSRTIR
jgi:hypothetical protein